MIIEWIATGIGISGAILNAFKRIEGFYLWLISNLMFIYVAIVSKLYGAALLFLVYFCISIWGIVSWRKKK